MYRRVNSALASINQLDKYKEKFEEHEMDDATVDQCLNNQSFITHFNEIIPVVGHRLRFITEFEKLGKEEKELNTEEDQGAFEMVNDEVTILIPETINQLSSSLQTNVSIQDGFRADESLDELLAIAHRKALEIYEKFMEDSFSAPNGSHDPQIFLDPEILDDYSGVAGKIAIRDLLRQFSQLEETPPINFRQEQLKLEQKLGESKAAFHASNNLRRTKAEHQMETAFHDALRDYKVKMVDKLNLKDNFKYHFVSNEDVHSLHNSISTEILHHLHANCSSNPLYKTTQGKIMDEVNKELLNFQCSVQMANKNLANQHTELLAVAVSKYEKKMSEFSGLDNEAYWRNHDHFKSAQLKDLDLQLTQRPNPAQLQAKLGLELSARIDESFAQFRGKLDARQKKFQEDLKAEEEKAIKHYTTEMENFFGGTENCFFEETTLATRHTSTEERVFSSFKLAFGNMSGGSSGSGSAFAREHLDIALDRLVSAIEIKYNQIREQNKNRESNFIFRCRNTLSAAQNLYTTKIKNIMEDATDEEELMKKEEVIRKEAQTHLQQSLNSATTPTDQPDFFTKLENELDEHMTSYFEDHLELFQLQQEQDEVMVKRALYDAKTYYNEEMEKRFVARDFIPPKELLSLNGKLMTAAFAKCQEEIELSDAQEKKLREAMRTVYLKFAERNLMRVPMENPAIGIDLGTTYSCVGIYNNGKVVIIPNENGNRTTPSYVAYQEPTGSSSGPSIVVGDVAKSQSFMNPSNTIFDAKRLIGRKFSDPVVQKDMKTWPFEVVDVDDIPKIKVGDRKYSPEEISAQVLKKMKKIAEDYLGIPNCVRDCVITVPALFNDGQRQATRDAGQIAGLNVLKIINEPTAAAIAFQLHRADDLRRNVLIFDLGGGTFDVAILEMVDGDIKVKAVHGDTHLGGEDFDGEMIKYCIQAFKTTYGVDLGRGSNDRFSKEAFGASSRLRRIRNECQEQKRVLSSSLETRVTRDSIDGALNLDVPFTRSIFESLNQGHFDECLRIVQLALDEAHLTKSQIDDIVLVGGSTRIPKIQEMLSNFFDGRALSKQINPDEAVAYGAAIQACLLAKKKSGVGADSLSLTVHDVCPLSIGIRVHDESLSVIIPKNTPVPTSFTKVYYKVYDDQTKILVSVYEGEDFAVAARNNLLGEFTLKGIPVGPPHRDPVDITMMISDEGILNVKAVVRNNNSTNQISITTRKKRLTIQEIEKAQAAA